MSEFREESWFNFARCKPGLNLLAAIVLVFQASAPAQTGVMPSNQWSALTSRTPGETMIVKLKSGEKIKGALQHASDDKVVLRRGNKDLEFKSEDIASVAVPGQRKSVVKPTLIGLAIGAGVGAGIGAAVNGNESGQDFIFTKGQERALGAALGGVVGAVGGSLIGYFAGRGRRSEVLIYEPLQRSQQTDGTPYFSSWFYFCK